MMKNVTIRFAENVYHSREHEKVEIRVVSGALRDDVNKAFDTFNVVANKFVNDLDKAGFKGATADIPYIGGAYGGLKVSSIIRIPRSSDSHEMHVALKDMIRKFEKWANTEEIS